MAVVSAVIGYLTLTEGGRVDQPSVPIVRVVVGALQFAVAGAAILAVMCAALGLKPGGSRLLLVVRTHACMCACAYTYIAVVHDQHIVHSVVYFWALPAIERA